MPRLTYFIFILILSCGSLLATPSGKLDVGPTYLNVEQFFSGEKVRTSNFYGLEAKARVNFDGLILKPDIVAATGDGNLISASLGLGTELCWKNFSFIPLVGMGVQRLRTPAPEKIFGDDVSEHRSGRLGFVGADLLYDADNWSFLFSYTYTWSHTHVTVDYGFSEFDFHETVNGGYIVMAQIDYYLTPCWSIGLGGCLDRSYVEEKHGLKIYSIILTCGYSF